MSFSGSGVGLVWALLVGGLRAAGAFLAILVLFGGRKIPELMRGLGQGVKEFKDGIKEEDKPEDTK